MPDVLERRAIVFEHAPTSQSAVLRMVVGALLVTGVGLALGFAVHAISPVAAEERALAALAQDRTATATTFFLVVTTLGDLWVVALVAAIATPLLTRLTGGWQAAWLLWTAMLGTLAVTAVIKVIVGRARPLDALTAADSGAFPSGHTSRAAAVLGLGIWAVVLLARHPGMRVLGVTVLGVGIALMGFSRLYLGVHWPTDVAYGLIVGLAWLLVLLAAVRPRVLPIEHVPPGEPRIEGPG
jgi:membrane-associated phospholipid phosphatase